MADNSQEHKLHSVETDYRHSSESEPTHSIVEYSDEDSEKDGRENDQATSITAEDSQDSALGTADGSGRERRETFEPQAPAVLELALRPAQTASAGVSSESSHSKASESASTQPEADESTAEAPYAPHYATWMPLKLSEAVGMASQFRTDSEVRSRLRSMFDAQVDEDAVMFVTHFVQLKRRLRVLQG